MRADYGERSEICDGTVEYGSHATAASGDDGIDGIIMEDKLGFSLIYAGEEVGN